MGVEYWESIIGMACSLNGMYAIIPKRNLVQNLGISANATHSIADDLELIPKNERELYFRIGEELDFPLKHPQYVLPDAEFARKIDKKDNPSVLKLLSDKARIAVLAIRKGRFDLICSAIKKEYHNKRTTEHEQIYRLWL